MANGSVKSRFVKRRALITSVLILVLVWILIAFFRSGKIEPGLIGESGETLSNQTIEVVASQQLPIRRELIGSIQSRVPLEAASRVAARVTAVEVRSGDRVHAGQILTTLDASQLNDQVAQARGDLSAAQAELTRAGADEQRFSALFARGSVTAREHDAAEAAFRSAQARSAQAQAAVTAARANLEYATIRSPVDGVVVERLVEPGDMAMPGQALIRLYDQTALRVELQAPEDLARQIEVGTPIDVRVDSTGADYQTQVSEVVPAADPASRTFLVRAPLPSGQHLTPGMFARASLAVGREAVLTVPRSAVEQIGQLQTVHIYSNGRVQTRMVSLGRVFGDRVEVLAGVRQNERVVLDPAVSGHQ